MLNQKPIPALLLLCSLCFSQTINISGTVTDTAGSPLASALVKLEKSGLSDTTGSDGTFLLSGIVGISKKSNKLLPQKLSAAIHHGRLKITAAAKSVVKISAFTMRGRAVFEIKETVDAGTRSLALPRFGAGVYLYRIQSGSSSFVLKSPTIGRVSQGSVRGSSSAIVANRDIIDDVIKVSKTGYLNNRVPVTNSDTSGIAVALILQDAGTVTDIDGNVYHAIRIGDQVWTVENFRATRYNDGTPINHITDRMEWGACTTGTEAYCYYNNTTNADSIKMFGALYNWLVIGTKKLAPDGWHVAGDTHWSEMEEFLIANGYNWDGSTSGNKTGKSISAKTDWSSSSDEGDVGNDLSTNNTSGFSALPGGYRTHKGYFNSLGRAGRWWTRTPTDPSNALNSYLYYDDGHRTRFINPNENGYSVRLLRY